MDKETSYAIASLELILEDGSNLVAAVAKGCEQMNYTTAPMVAVIRARQHLDTIKKYLDANEHFKQDN